jgi:hypothetical protein
VRAKAPWNRREAGSTGGGIAAALIEINPFAAGTA